ncbi:hypothetical protein BH24ACT18_BH24ACT18_00780 [soil metagenome]
MRQEGGLDAVPTAMGGGELVLDDEGCLRMLLPGKGSESGWVPVWPPYFEPKTGGGRVRIVDERSGRVVAEVGKGVVMSGGDISKEALRRTGSWTKRRGANCSGGVRRATVTSSSGEGCA